LIKLPPR